MERKYIKTFEQFINEQTMNEGEISQEAQDKVLKESVINESRSYGILFVTKDLKNILDYHHDYKEVPLKVGIDMTNYIMDDNEYGANLDIEEHPKLDIAWIKVPYSFNNNRAYRGTIVKQSSNLE